MRKELMPYMTADGVARAVAADKGGFALKGKYIAVGNGHRQIKLDKEGKAITNQLANVIGYIEILSAEKVNPYQWQMAVDVARLNDDVEWNFTEFALCDKDKNVIAIYGHSNHTIFTVTPYVDNALIGINLLLGIVPADSIVIEHHNLPLKLFFDKEFSIIVATIISNMKNTVTLGADITENKKLLVERTNKISDQRKYDLEVITSAIVSNNTSVIKLGHVMEKTEKNHQDQFNQLSALYINNLTDQVKMMGLLYND